MFDKKTKKIDPLYLTSISLIWTVVWLIIIHQLQIVENRSFIFPEFIGDRNNPIGLVIMYSIPIVIGAFGLGFGIVKLILGKDRFSSTASVIVGLCLSFILIIAIYVMQSLSTLG